MVMMEFTSAGIWILYNIYADPLGSKVMIIRLQIVHIAGGISQSALHYFLFPSQFSPFRLPEYISAVKEMALVNYRPSAKLPVGLVQRTEITYIQYLLLVIDKMLFVLLFTFLNPNFGMLPGWLRLCLISPSKLATRGTRRTGQNILF